MTLEDSVTCPHCDKETFVCSDVPNSAWQPMGAYFTWKEECQSCDEMIELSGEVRAEVDIA